MSSSVCRVWDLSGDKAPRFMFFTATVHKDAFWEDECEFILGKGLLIH